MNIKDLAQHLQKNEINEFITDLSSYLKNGGDINEKYEGYTLLGYICKNQEISQKKSIDLIKLLVQSGADIHANDADGFRYACINGKNNEVEYFLQQGVDVSVLNNFGVRFAPIENVELIKLLVENGADPLADNGILVRYILTQNNPEKIVLDLITFLCEKKIKLEAALNLINDKKSVSPQAVMIIKRYDIFQHLEEGLKDTAITVEKVKKVKI
jgi:ankyrin repeat protein